MDKTQFNPDLQLEPVDRAALAAIYRTAGYLVLHRIMRTQIDTLVLSLINATGVNQDEVLAKHRLAKAASMFYAQTTAVVDHEVQLYLDAPRTTDKPIDVTEDVLDLGDIHRSMSGVPNLLGEEEEIFDE